MKSLGCWADTKPPGAIDGGVRFRSVKNPIEECRNYAQEQGFSVFAVQNGKECFTAANAADTYKRYGTSNKCKDGAGGPKALDVYEIDCAGKCSWDFSAPH